MELNFILSFFPLYLSCFLYPFLFTSLHSALSDVESGARCTIIAPSHFILFDQLDDQMIREIALKTEGAVGPSGLDAAGWKHLCTSFQSASTDLAALLLILIAFLPLLHVVLLTSLD